MERAELAGIPRMLSSGLVLVFLVGSFIVVGRPEGNNRLCKDVVKPPTLLTVASKTPMVAAIFRRPRGTCCVALLFIILEVVQFIIGLWR